MNAPAHTLPAAKFNRQALAYSRYLNTMRREAKARALRRAQMHERIQQLLAVTNSGKAV